MVKSLSYVNSICQNIEISQQTDCHHHFANNAKDCRSLRLGKLFSYRYFKVYETKQMAVKYFMSKNNELTATFGRKIYFENICEMTTTKYYLIMH